MQIVVCCTEAQREELTSLGVAEAAKVVWVFEKGYLVCDQTQF